MQILFSAFILLVLIRTDSTDTANTAALTADTDFKLPTVELVHGSFMIKVAWVIRGQSNRQYAIVSNASEIGFDVLDANQSTTVIAQRRGVWQSWTEDGVYVIYKHKTLVVRANGWEAHAALSHSAMHTAHVLPLCACQPNHT